MKSKNIRLYEDNGNLFGANHVEGVENRYAPGVVIYAWAFIEGVLTMSVWVGDDQFCY